MTRDRPDNPTRRRGAAYIIALLVVTVLAAVALGFAREMRTEADISANHASKTQARWIAYGALEAIRGEIRDDLSQGLPPVLDTVGADAVALGEGVFWVIGRGDRAGEPAFGLVSEAGKINLNTATPETLVELPGVTETLAAAILDWRDTDAEATPGGAESLYYLGLDDGYRAKDARLESVGEVMLVRGVTPEVYHGEDANRNSRLDPNEDDGGGVPPLDNGDGRLDPGLVDLCTVHSREPNEDADGNPRININVGDSSFIDFLREQIGQDRFAQVFVNIVINRPFRSPLELFIKAELTREEYEQIRDRITTDNTRNFRGRVDVYAAPAEVLDALPGLDPGDGEIIVRSRPELLPGEPRPSLAWLVDLLGEEKAVEAAASLTNRSYQFTADIVAVSRDGRSFCRLTAVLDATRSVRDGELPRVVKLTEQTDLGWPLEPEVLGALRRGETVERVAAAYRGAMD